MKRFLTWLVLMLGSLAATVAAGEPPIVGAIRWDGWYGEGGVAQDGKDHSFCRCSLGVVPEYLRKTWQKSVAGGAAMQQEDFMAVV